MPVETPSAEEATDIIAADDLSAPVFVDATGRRGRRIKIAFSAVGAVTLAYALMIATSLAGGPLKPQQLLPFPDLVQNRPAPATPSAVGPATKSTPVSNNSGTGKRIKTGPRPVTSGAPPAAAPEAPDAARPSPAATDEEPAAEPPTTPPPTEEPTEEPTAPQPSASDDEDTALPDDAPTVIETTSAGTVIVDQTAAEPTQTVSAGSDPATGSAE